MSGTTRRRWLAGSAASIGAAPFARWARAADEPRFALGVASGQPRADGLVLWTRLTGDGLPERAEVRWQLAEDEAFARVVASGVETAHEGDAHSVHAEPAGLAPGRWFWYRFEALGQRSPAGRTRTAPAPGDAATLRFVIASCQRYDVGRYAAWRDAAEWAPDLVAFLGDYVYEYPSSPLAPRPHRGGYVRTLDDYRERHAQYRSDAQLQAAHAACPWLVIWDDHEVDNDYAGLVDQRLQPDFAAQREAAYKAWWEHMPVPKTARPVGPDTRIHFRLDWGTLARWHALDARQHRDPQACPPPGRGGSTTVRLRDCPALADPRRSLLGAAQERWLADGWDTVRPWNLVAQTTLMARFSWTDPAADGGTYWTDGWDGYPASRRRLLDGLAERKLRGAVVLGGDVHAHYVAALKADFDDEKAPVLASEFTGTSISSLPLAQPRIDAARAFNPHVLLGDGTKRGTVRFTVDAKRLAAELRAVDDPLDAASEVRTAARFVVEAGRPGPVAA